MRKIIVFAALAALTLSCTELYGPIPESVTPDKPSGIEIKLEGCDDYTASITVTPSAASSYYSWLVDEADEAEQLDADKLYAGKYSSIANGVEKWSADQPSYTIKLIDLNPNTTYQVYAVAGSPMGIPGEVAVASFKTSDKVCPELDDFDFSDEKTVLSLSFSENVVRGEGALSVRYFGINTAGILNDAELGSVEAAESDIVIKGSSVLVTLKGIPNGAYYTLDYPEGAFVDLAGNPAESLSSGFIFEGGSLAPYGVYGRAPKAEFKLKAIEDMETFSDAGMPFITSSDSETYVIAKLGKGSAKAVYSSQGKTISYELGANKQYGVIEYAGIPSAVVFLPEAPAYGSVVNISIGKDCFQDIYGNSNAAWNFEALFAYNYTIEDVLGTYEVYAFSYWDGDLAPTILKIEGSDDASKGNVMITAFMGFSSKGSYNVYADFNAQAGTLSIADGQPLFGLKYGEYPINFAVNTDTGEPAVLQMPESGILTMTDDSLWFGIYISSNGWYDVYTSFTAIKTDESSVASVTSLNVDNLKIRSKSRVLR